MDIAETSNNRCTCLEIHHALEEGETKSCRNHCRQTKGVSFCTKSYGRTAIPYTCIVPNVWYLLFTWYSPENIQRCKSIRWPRRNEKFNNFCTFTNHRYTTTNHKWIFIGRVHVFCHVNRCIGRSTVLSNCNDHRFASAGCDDIDGV